MRKYNSLMFSIVFVLFCVSHGHAENPGNEVGEDVALLQNMYEAEHSLLYPSKDLLFVMFAQNHGADIFLEKVELTIDGEKVVSHEYSWGDVAKLMDEAVQQLYITLVLPGSHSLYVRLYGRGLVSKDYLEGKLIIEKGGDPIYIQMSINGNQLKFESW